MKLRDSIAVLVLASCIALWMLESVVEHFIFDQGPFLRGLLGNISGHELWMRLLTMAVVILFGVAVSISTKRLRETQDRVNHLNLILRSIRNVAQLIAHENDLDKLIGRACESLTENRGYHHAWIVLLDESKRVVGTAESGLGGGFAPILDIFERGGFPNCSRAVLDHGGTAVIGDVTGECGDCPLSGEYAAHGAFISRLEYGQRDYGLIGVSIPSQMTSDDEERALFEELAGDLSFALHGIEAQQKRTAAEEELRASETRYRLMFENMGSGSAIFGAVEEDGEIDFVLKDINPAGQKIDKAMKDDIVGKKVTECFPSIRTFGLFEVLLRVNETGKAERHPTSFYADNRIAGWRDNYVYRLPSGDIVTIYEDVTEQKKAEKALVEASNIIDKSPAVAFLWRNEQGWPVEFVSKNVEDLFGYTSEDFSSGAVAYGNCIHPDDLKRVSDEVDRFSGKTDATGFKHQPYRIVKKDGEIRWVDDDTEMRRDADGHVTHYQGIVRDITERMRVEAELDRHRTHLEELVMERTRELEETQNRLVRQEKLAVLGKLAGGLGHELRNPLGAIKNAGYFLDMAIEAKEPEIKEALQILQKETIRCEGIVSSLLDFTRPRAPAPRDVKIKDLMELCLSGLHIPQNVKIETSAIESEKQVLADPDQLVMVLRNLILNSIQAMEGVGGQITVSSGVSHEGYMDISVTDTGRGMSKDDAMRAFEPLFTTKSRGIGLGLAISRHIVETHGGSLSVESELGKGSTFMIRIPSGVDK
ncbi:MAG: PAS domain-containing protein [Candidatus Coatesbacteria bacterium]|nr:PAS domain-containing protein [Candidatus Coatesbacteria bacterium]